MHTPLHAEKLKQYFVDGDKSVSRSECIHVPEFGSAGALRRASRRVEAQRRTSFPLLRPLAQWAERLSRHRLTRACPQCVLSCAKEHRVLPNQGFTCCLAMDGVNILASGFEKDEKADIAKMVTAMGGVLHTKASSDVSFVIAKNVLAQKYKVCVAPAGRRVYGHTWASSFCQPNWVEINLGQEYGLQWALNNLKKPIVSSNWLVQCWKEHRVVPQESYKVLPFSGLTICVSGIPADERKEVEKLVMQNGGKYSAELTKRCTHLVCDISFVFSLLLCILILPTGVMVCGSYALSYPSLKTLEQHSQGKVIRNSQYSSSSMATASDSETNLSAQDMEPDLEIPLPNICPTFFGVPPLPKEGNDPPADEHKNDSDFARCIADDSQCEDDDLYLSECRILLVGFEASELRKLVDMVRQGGGSRYMSFNQKLTHVVVGNPSETKNLLHKHLAASRVDNNLEFGSVMGLHGNQERYRNVVITRRVDPMYFVHQKAWLEECTFRKKEVPVLKSHIAYDLLLPKDPLIFNKTTGTSMTVSKQGKSSISQPVDSNILEHKNSQFEVSFGLGEEVKLKVQTGVGNGIKHTKSSTVFKGKLFRFSSSFPREQRPEIVLWVNEGGGEVVANQNEKNVHFIVERHGEVSSLKNTVRSTYVTTHWIYSCLEDGCLLDVSSHILYSPLSCQIPLPGFERYCICVSRYDMKERQLLRNLCYVLGAKFIDKLTRKVTHLLCKFADGDKYEAACRWGIHVVTAEWIYECAMQNKVADLARFHPKGLTSQDQQAGLYSVSQYPSQSVRMTSGDDASQHPSLLQDMRNMLTVASTGCMARDEENYSSSGNKRARVLGNDSIKRPLSCEPAIDNSVNMKNPTENNVTENTVEVSVVPDVAAAIEDLLEQTSKIQDRKSPETSGCHENFLFSNPTMLGQSHVDPQSIPGPSKHWMNRIEKRDDNPSADAAATVLYDGFSETQTDSQVVGYEEDLTGRQMIIDRVRTRSSMP
ncbi:hypothetical protein DH2020_044686 [Rehmannia glutinosa]|uniref:BRCT domain-containing protein n=1 Tax=Rehmannia glutinosa TaxID=99300 RepID=A0ABR0UGH5_REHGL